MGQDLPLSLSIPGTGELHTVELQHGDITQENRFLNFNAVA